MSQHRAVIVKDPRQVLFVEADLVLRSGVSFHERAKIVSETAHELSFAWKWTKKGDIVTISLVVEQVVSHSSAI